MEENYILPFLVYIFFERVITFTNKTTSKQTSA